MLYRGREQSASVNILDYFRLRKAWDAKERVASAEVVRLKEAQLRYARREVENLYASWRQGIVADDEAIRDASHSVEPGNAPFRTLKCGSSLKVSSDHLGCDVENWMEGGVAREGEQQSGRSSVQVSGS